MHVIHVEIAGRDSKLRVDFKKRISVGTLSTCSCRISLILERIVCCTLYCWQPKCASFRDSEHRLFKLWSSVPECLCLGGTCCLHLQGEWIGLGEC